MLAKVARNVVTFLKREEGPTAVEYAVMLAFIISACFVAISNIGSQTAASFQNPALQSAMTTAASS